MPKFLVSGCSYTENSLWPSELFSDLTVLNLGKSGAGNTYISESIIDALNKYDDIQQVFVLFSGVNRTDIVVPNTDLIRKFLSEYRFGQVIDNRCYIFSGGDKYTNLILNNYNNIKSDLWPSIHSLDEYFELPLNIRLECEQKKIFYFDCHGLDGLLHHTLMSSYFDNSNFLSDRTYLSVKNCIDILEYKKIPYHFSFIYNPWDTDFSNHFGTLDANSPLRKQIDWNKYIDFTPFEFCIEENLLAEDQIHMSRTGQIKWAKQLKKFLI